MNKIKILKIILPISLMLIIVFIIYIINYNSTDKKQENFTDINNNNFLDFLELNSKDSKSFNLWFNNIVINVFNKNINIPDNYSDCAGLIRYSYKESLKVHDQEWIKNTGYKGYKFEDIKKYNYPYIPFIGSKIFLTDYNIYNIDHYSNFASARYLIEFNMKKISKNIKYAQSGDILAFFHPQDIEYPYHLMIYIKQNNTEYVIYHTGPISENNPGELRLVLADDLKYADPTWALDENNNNFLGIFRFKILSDNFE